MFVEAVCEAAEQLASAEVDQMDDDEMKEAVAGLERAKAGIAAVEGRLLAALHERRTCDREYGSNTATWLSNETGISKKSAWPLVRVGRALRTHFPLLDQALAEGRISWDHARVVVNLANPRVIDQVATIQQQMIDLIDGATFDQWERDVRSLIQVIDQDGGHDPSRHARPTSARLADLPDGSTQLDAVLDPEDGAEVRSAVERCADELFHQRKRDAEEAADLPMPTRSQLLGQALVELVRRGTACDRSTRSPARPEITLVARAERPHDACTFDGRNLPPDVVERMACDADWLAVVLDADGVPLHHGHTVRRATTHQRRAAAVRDGGCVFPGCDAPPSWCDAHHVVPWEADGATDIDNLALLCRRHHGVTHRRGWSMVADADGWFTWTTPSGHVLHSQRHRRRRAGPDEGRPPDDAPPEARAA